MTTLASSRSGRGPFGVAAGVRGAAIVMGMALLLGGCGRGHNQPSRTAKTSSRQAPASAAATPASAPPALHSHPVAAASAAQAQQQIAAAARAKLTAMSVPDLLAAARDAYAQHRLVAPAGDNAMEYYEAVLAKDPGNQVAKDALREIFPFSVPDVEQSISQNDFTDAGREIDVLAKADPTNYTLTLLRSKLDAQKKLQARQQQEAQQKAQKDAELAAADEAAQKAAAERAAAQQAEEKEAAAKAAAAKKLAEEQAAVAKAAPPPEPVGETRAATVLAPASPQYPIEAARNQTSGYAVVEFTVTAKGSVRNAHVVDSAPRRVFDTAAILAIEHSRFEPAMKDGQPVASVLRRRIDFKFGG